MQTRDAVNQSITGYDWILNIFQEYSLHSFLTSVDRSSEEKYIYIYIQVHIDTNLKPGVW